MQVYLVLLLALASCVAGLAPFRDFTEKVADEYIIVLKRDLTSDDLVAHMNDLKSDFQFSTQKQTNSLITHWVIGKFLGFHARLSADMLARERANEQVAYIDANGIARIVQDNECVIQDDAIWNLARVNERDVSLVDDTYSYENKGAGVDVFIVDTGIRITHDEFIEGRAIWGTNTVGDNNNNDCNGHGTHVASTVAGAQYGLAKNATVIAVKVLSCGGSGSWAGVISGIQWTVNNRRPGRGAVSNMSLGGGYIQSVNDATDAAADAGIVQAVASGNSNADACNFSPASSDKAISVVATTIVQQGGSSRDQRSSFSNFGPCTHIAAPGQLVKGAWHTSNTATNTISGTSMASPHIAGAAAIVLSQTPGLNPAQVLARLLDGATKNVVDLACGNRAVCLQTPNNFLYSYTCDL
jgi:subtilisin family serine protease